MVIAIDIDAATLLITLLLFYAKVIHIDGHHIVTHAFSFAMPHVCHIADTPVQY